jgi:hypothetical protein
MPDFEIRIEEYDEEEVHEEALKSFREFLLAIFVGIPALALLVFFPLQVLAVFIGLFALRLILPWLWRSVLPWLWRSVLPWLWRSVLPWLWRFPKWLWRSVLPWLWRSPLWIWKSVKVAFSRRRRRL